MKKPMKNVEIITSPRGGGLARRLRRREASEDIEVSMSSD
jgi:hypothetical protein